MSPRRLTVLAAAALAGAALLPLLVACSGAVSVLDTKQTEYQISNNLATKFAVPNPVVTCPKGVKVQAQKTFDCHTVIEGQPLTVGVTLSDALGHFTLKPAAAVVIVARIAGAIQNTEATATVRCGPHTVLVEPPRSTFGCTAATASGPVTYRVTVEDLAGNVSYQPVAAPGASSATQAG